MKNTRGSVIVALFGLTACLACSKKSDEESAMTPSPPPAAPPPAVAPPAPDTAAPPSNAPEYGAAAAAAGMSGTLTAEPNPVAVCDKTGVGTVKLSWTASGVQAVEIRVGTPDGAVLSMAQGAKGNAKTGDWVKQGTTFYLQNATADAPRTLDHTLAKLEITDTVTKPCK